VGSATCLYGVDDIKGQEVIVIVEGEMDKLAVQVAGWHASASVPNGASQHNDLWGYGAWQAVQAANRVYIATDMDEGGETCATNLVMQIGYTKCYRVKWRGGCKDANDVLMDYGWQAVDEDIRNAKVMAPVGMPSLRSVQGRMLDRIQRRMPDEFVSGLSTGWKSFDEYYKPVTGELTVITGSPGSGKSEWLLSLVLNIARNHGKRFLLFAFEAVESGLTMQLLEKHYEASALDLRDACKTCEEVENAVNNALEWLDAYVCYGARGFTTPNIDQVLELAGRESASERNLWGLIIDPYNYLAHGENYRGSETQHISSMLTKLKRFALENNCHVFIVAHPTKSTQWADADAAKRKPSLYDISGSAHWFNKCDNGIIVAREFLEVNGEEIATPWTEVDVQKVRNKEAGKLGSHKFKFDVQRRSYNDQAVEQAWSVNSLEGMDALIS